MRIKRKSAGFMVLCMSMAMLTACNTDDSTQQAEEKENMFFYANVDGYATGDITRTTDLNTFETGDIIYVDKYTNGTSGNRYNTPKAYRFGGQYFEAVDPTIKNGTTGTWSWELWQEKVYAFKRGDGGGTLQDEFTVKSDQSTLENTAETQGMGAISGTTGYLNSDFLFSTEKTINFGNGPVGTLSNFKHMVARIIVKVADGAMVSDGEGTEAFDASKLQYCTIGDNIMMMTGTVSTAGVLTAKAETGGTIKMYPRTNNSGVITQFECFVIPQTINASEKKFVKLRYNNKTYIYTQSRDITFKQGESHTITITSLHTDAVEVPLMYTTLTKDHIGYVMCSDGTCWRTAAIAVQNGYAAGRKATNADKGQVLGMVAYLSQEYKFTDQDNVQVSKGLVLALEDAGACLHNGVLGSSDYILNIKTKIDSSPMWVNELWYAQKFHNDATINLPKKPSGTYWTVPTYYQWMDLMKQVSQVKLKEGTADEKYNSQKDFTYDHWRGWDCMNELLADRCSGYYTPFDMTNRSTIYNGFYASSTVSTYTSNKDCQFIFMNINHNTNSTPDNPTSSYLNSGSWYTGHVSFKSSAVKCRACLQF